MPWTNTDNTDTEFTEMHQGEHRCNTAAALVPLSQLKTMNLAHQPHGMEVLHAKPQHTGIPSLAFRHAAISWLALASPTEGK